MVKDKVNVCCPVCGTWFYRKPGTRTKYDKELCKKIAFNVQRKRKSAK